MTPKQRKLARHALGLPNRTKRSYRNRFRASYVPGDYDHWDKMGDAGLAIKSTAIYEGSVAFWLTEKGAKLALETGESLCPEDFPNANP